MSEYSTLSELARFIGRSELAADDPVTRRHAIDSITARLSPRPAHRRIADLLGVVLALSARTKRMALPRVGIELDVFGPDGRRALRIHLPGSVRR
jgi:hypothetical protein